MVALKAQRIEPGLLFSLGHLNLEGGDLSPLLLSRKKSHLGDESGDRSPHCKASSRPAHTKSRWHDLKRRRQTAYYLAIKFDADDGILFQRASDDLFGQRMVYFIHAEVRAEIKPRRIAKNPECTRVTNADYIEQPVIQFSIRSDLHRPAVVARVGHTEFRDSHTTLVLFVELYVNFDRRYSKRRLHRSRRVRKLTAEFARREGRNPFP